MVRLLDAGLGRPRPLVTTLLEPLRTGARAPRHAGLPVRAGLMRRLPMRARLVRRLPGRAHRRHRHAGATGQAGRRGR
jgi:hypothetical protein